MRPARAFASAVSTLLLLSAMPAPSRAAPTRADSVTAWIARTAHTFSTCDPAAGQQDVSFLAQLVGDAHIVALGEGTHGTSEFFQLKHRITRYLASELGFSVFAIEANMPEAHRVNDYVLTGRGDPRELLDGMYFWTWNTHEVLDMIEWMRAFNASGRGRIQFTGFDMQTPDTAAAIAARSFRKVDAPLADSIATVLARVKRARNVAQSGGFATATGTFPTDAAAGHHVRYSGWIRTTDVQGFAGLWMRADTAAMKPGAFSNMMEQQIQGTRGWRRYSLELDIPKNTININFGMLLAGRGEAWFDSLAIETDGRPWPGTPELDLALERDRGPVGFSTWTPAAYRIEQVNSGAHDGRRALRIAHLGTAEPSDEARTWKAEAATACAELLARAERRRDELARRTTKAEADWALQNLRVVEQCARMGRDAALPVRDESMAANVDWILAHEKPGTRIVLWAHNAHVARRGSAMGSFLDERHGRDMVVLGFAAHHGRYTAWREQALSSENALAAPDSAAFEALAHASGLPRFVLDLRTASRDAAAAAYLASRPRMRSIGAMAMTQQFWPADLSGEYDAIVYVDETHATRLMHPPR